MRNKFNLILFVLLSSYVYGQNTKVNDIDSYKLFVATLNVSKDIIYSEILDEYNQYIDLNPDDILVQIYRCKFIGNAYVDPYEEYNYQYEETKTCIQELYEKFPTNPDVIIYKLENNYYEDDGDLIDEALAIYSENKTLWSYDNISKLYELAARYYEDNDDIRAIKLAETAEKFSSSLDLSVLLTKAYLREGNKTKAKSLLLDALHFDNEAWILKQKGNLLIDFGETEEAIKMFERVQQKDSTFNNNLNFYKIFVGTKDYEKARSFLVKDTLDDWNKVATFQKLLNHDIAYSNPEIALNSYRRMQELSYYDDFLGIKRIRIFLKSPLKKWTLLEISHILTLLILLLILFILPYIWILPVYSAKKFFNINQKEKEKHIPVDWSLKHFWMVSFLYLTSQLLLIIFILLSRLYKHFFRSSLPIHRRRIY